MIHSLSVAITCVGSTRTQKSSVNVQCVVQPHDQVVRWWTLPSSNGLVYLSVMFAGWQTSVCPYYEWVLWHLFYQTDVSLSLPVQTVHSRSAEAASRCLSAGRELFLSFTFGGVCDVCLLLALPLRCDEAAWTRWLIFSRLHEAWWDVEADSWIDWPLLSAQGLITTALKCSPSISLPRSARRPLLFASPSLVISLSKTVHEERREKTGMSNKDLASLSGSARYAK